MLWPGDCAAAIVRAHRHGMRVVLVVQLGWSGLLSASLASLGVLAAHLDQSGVIGAWSTVARGGRGLRVRLHLLVTEGETYSVTVTVVIA